MNGLRLAVLHPPHCVLLQYLIDVYCPNYNRVSLHSLADEVHLILGRLLMDYIMKGMQWNEYEREVPPGFLKRLEVLREGMAFGYGKTNILSHRVYLARHCRYRRN